MLVVYLSSLIVGGSLLSFSIFSGGHDADGDFDTDLDADASVDGFEAESADVDGGHDDLHDFGALDVWLPLTSLRFWTFFLAFFGLVGTALALASPMALTLTLVPSAGVGYLSGISAVRVLRVLSRQQIGAALDIEGLVGEVGQLLLPVAPGQDGKILLEVAGRTLELTAESDDEELKLGDSAVVLGVREGGSVWVGRASASDDDEMKLLSESEQG
jgi:membrane protein implicated in regulation of membrane protease activity